MNRRQFIHTAALAAGAVSLGMRPAGAAAEDDLTAAQSTCEPSGLKWQRVGPDFKPTEGMCCCALPHPQRPGELLVGTRPQGLLLSRDRGRTWRHASERFPENCHIGPNQESMARAASQPDTVYAGIESLGVRRSDDGGRTWRDLGAGLPAGRAHNGVSAAVHPTNPDIAWLGTDGGIFKTNDGGRTWRRLTAGLLTGAAAGSRDVNQTITNVFVDAHEPHRVWLSMFASGLNEPAGVWRSEDGGEIWVHSSDGIDRGDQATGPVASRRDWVMGLSRSISEPQVFFAVTPFFVYRSADGAKTWLKLPRSGGGHAVAVHPRNASHVFLAAEKGRTAHSTDGGKTWRDISKGLRLGREPGAPVIKITFIGPDGKSQELEATDRRFENQILSFAFDPRDPNTLYACAHAGLYRLDLGSSWNCRSTRRCPGRDRRMMRRMVH